MKEVHHSVVTESLLEEFFTSQTSNEALHKWISATLSNTNAQLGSLKDLTGFSTEVTSVLYLIDENQKNNILLIFTNHNSVRYEFSTDLASFWPIWESETLLNELPNMIEEILYFLQTGEIKTTHLFTYNDGLRNQRIHRALRSRDKCRHVKSVFGISIIGSES